MHEEFEKLLKVLEKAQEEINPSINELLLKTLSFFNSLKAQFKTANDEEKKEIIALMKDMHSKLTDEVKHMIKKTGLDEDELANFMKDPEHFTPEQQEILKRTQDEADRTKKEILDSSGPKEEKKSADHAKKSPKKRKKGKWMKS